MIVTNGTTDDQMEKALYLSIADVNFQKEEARRKAPGSPATPGLANFQTATTQTHNIAVIHPAPPEAIDRANGQFQFRRAVKYDANLRLAVTGPGGSGKTFTLLKIATELGGKIALVDTEHGSASKYADLFAFDVIEPRKFDPGIVPDLIRTAASQGYRSLIFDSLTHYWDGEGGELDQVDNITARSKSNNSFAAWRIVSPLHNRMVDAMLAAPLHILVSMRVKTEWIVEKNAKGLSVPRKVGTQPIMKAGIEYEFDVCADMDQENNFVVSKSRCPELTNTVFHKPGRDVAEILKDWLASPNIKPQRPPEPSPQPEPDPPIPWAEKPWATFKEMLLCFQKQQTRIPEAAYCRILAEAGVEHPSDFIKPGKGGTPAAVACYRAIQSFADDKAVTQ